MFIDASALLAILLGEPDADGLASAVAYACARSLNVPLLYKGDDFRRTDLA